MLLSGDHTGASGRCGDRGSSARIGSPARTILPETTIAMIPALRIKLLLAVALQRRGHQPGDEPDAIGIRL